MSGHTSISRAALALLAVGCLPWAVLTSPGEVGFVFAWGLVGVDPLAVTTLFEFLFRYTAGLPGYILAWPVAVACYGLAVLAAVVGSAIGREDRRVTGGLLVVAGVSLLTFARAFSVQPMRTAWPVGTLWLWALAWWEYGPALRRLASLSRE